MLHKSPKTSILRGGEFFKICLFRDALSKFSYFDIPVRKVSYLDKRSKFMSLAAGFGVYIGAFGKQLLIIVIGIIGISAIVGWIIPGANALIGVAVGVIISVFLVVVLFLIIVFLVPKKSKNDEETLNKR